MSILNRISIIQEDSNLSERAFELSINKTSGYLNMMRKRNSNPGADVLAIILKVYPKYSAEWLLTGEGEKCKKTDALVNEPSALYGKPTIEKAVKELIPIELLAPRSNI